MFIDAMSTFEHCVSLAEICGRVSTQLGGWSIEMDFSCDVTDARAHSHESAPLTFTLCTHCAIRFYALMPREPQMIHDNGTIVKEFYDINEYWLRACKNGSIFLSKLLELTSLNLVNNSS